MLRSLTPKSFTWLRVRHVDCPLFLPTKQCCDGDSAEYSRPPCLHQREAVTALTSQLLQVDALDAVECPKLAAAGGPHLK